MNENNKGMEDNIITLIDDDGVEKDFEILFTYANEETQKQYVYFCDSINKDDEDDLSVYFMAYDEQGNLYRVDDEVEKDMLEDIYNTFIEDAGYGINE